MNHRLTGIARAEQIVQKAIEDREVPDVTVVSSAAQHATAIATIELAKATRMLALLKVLELTAGPHPVFLINSEQREQIRIASYMATDDLIPPREEPNS